MKDLKGKTAVVTGAAAGIGRAMALAFARKGMKLVLADLDADGLLSVAEEVNSLGARALSVPTDVTKPESVAKLADAAFAEMGAVHLLCNNAGVLGRILPSWQQPLENWRWVFDVNVQGVVNGIHTFLPRMLEQDSEGYVLNTGSVAGLITGPFFAPYNASKHAVVALSECLHHELRALHTKIEVGVLCPGWVNTGLAEIEQKLPEELRSVNKQQEAAEQVAAREKSVRDMVAASISPDEIAALVVEAVEQGRFYIFPHPERKADIESRMRDILAEREPAFPPRKLDQ
ncbi:MAG: SDR family NAD(P)-dependent oxidoreductase [Acidobacteria bacterium]|nr:SDR family NAD(P)-dependent oxidoreductase [Acidobacteriota bacterium]